jgi:hypothetical protein
MQFQKHHVLFRILDDGESPIILSVICHQPFRINYIVRLVTFLYFSMGEIVVELYWKHAPMTCRNFAELVRRNYYNGTKFHRIIRDFMIQGKLTLFFS